MVVIYSPKPGIFYLLKNIFISTGFILIPAHPWAVNHLHVKRWTDVRDSGCSRKVGVTKGDSFLLASTKKWKTKVCLMAKGQISCLKCQMQKKKNLPSFLSALEGFVRFSVYKYLAYILSLLILNIIYFTFHKKLRRSPRTHFYLIDSCGYREDTPEIDRMLGILG